MCTSLQSIVNVYDRTRLEKDIQLLFKPKPYPSFELQQFYKHELYENNQQFNFFLDILEEWNRKIITLQLPNHSDTLFHKNAYIFNTLRNSIMQPLASSHKVLEHLYNWFTDTRNKKIQPVERKIKEFTEQDEDWLVRNTFKSNLSAEIDMYRRRVCCKNPLQNEKNIVTHSGRTETDPSKCKKVKTECWTKEEGREVEQKKTTKIENQIIRFQREAKELINIQKRWKIKKARQQEGGNKNFYRGSFSSFKTYFPKKVKETQNASCSNLYNIKRVKTSSGFRQKENKTPIRLSDGGKEFVDVTKRNSEQLPIFDQFQEVKLSDIAGIRLLNNPQEIKLKKKKRAK